MRELLVAGDLAESWIPPECVLEWRERVSLYKALIDQRTQWTQRIHAELFQHGVAQPEGEIRSEATRSWPTDPGLAVSPAARRRIHAGYAMIQAGSEDLRDRWRGAVRNTRCGAVMESGGVVNRRCCGRPAATDVTHQAFVSSGLQYLPGGK